MTTDCPRCAEPVSVITTRTYACPHCCSEGTLPDDEQPQEAANAELPFHDLEAP